MPRTLAGQAYPIAAGRVVGFEAQSAARTISTRHQDRVSPNPEMSAADGSFHCREDVAVQVKDVRIRIRVDKRDAILFAVRD